MIKFEDVKVGDYISLEGMSPPQGNKFIVLNKTPEAITGLEFNPMAMMTDQRVLFINYSKHDWDRPFENTSWRRLGKRAKIDRLVKVLALRRIFVNLG